MAQEGVDVLPWGVEWMTKELVKEGPRHKPRAYGCGTVGFAQTKDEADRVARDLNKKHPELEHFAKWIGPGTRE